MTLHTCVNTCSLQGYDIPLECLFVHMTFRVFYWENKMGIMRVLLYFFVWTSCTILYSSSSVFRPIFYCPKQFRFVHKCTWCLSIKTIPVDESGHICYQTRCHRKSDWICDLLTGSRLPRLALNVSVGTRHWQQASSTPRHASMMGPSQPRANRQTP